MPSLVTLLYLHFLNSTVLYMLYSVSLCNLVLAGGVEMLVTMEERPPNRMEGDRATTSGCVNLIGRQSKVSGKVRGVF